MGARGHGGDPSSSSGEEDGNAEWRAAIDSIAASSAFVSSIMNAVTPKYTNKPATKPHGDNDVVHLDDDGFYRPTTQRSKPYQVKAQRLLEDVLEKTLEIVKAPIDAVDHEPQNAEPGVRLFKRAPPGIVFDRIDELQQPKKRPRLLPGNDIDEKSKKVSLDICLLTSMSVVVVNYTKTRNWQFRKRIHAVAVNGEDIMSKAKMAYQKSLTRLEAKNAAANAAAKKEEERVETLKRIRGERWLPSIAKEMKSKSSG